MYIYLKDIEPITLNHSHKITTSGKFATMYKTTDYKQFESAVELQLRKCKAEFNKLNNKLDENKTCLKIDYKFYFPYMTKTRTIRKKYKDIDNLIKPLQDQLFKHISLDDSYVTELSASKIHSLNTYIEINVKIITY